jgi:hypothetical protein
MVFPRETIHGERFLRRERPTHSSRNELKIDAASVAPTFYLRPRRFDHGPEMPCHGGKHPRPPGQRRFRPWAGWGKRALGGFAIAVVPPAAILESGQSAQNSSKAKLV